MKIDITQLPEDAEATLSIAQATLTEGAIGYRRPEVLSGKKPWPVSACAMAVRRPSARRFTTVASNS